ncbi:MAG: flap endonuclease-1 [Desulfurococcales archaeon]|nr:flap endonuclease-1 [Desulfurococcales archaeon]
MGVDLRELIPVEAKKEVSLKDLDGRIIALDAYNMLYQFISAIRQPDGTPLMDSKGRITSHLSGLFYRTINMVETGIKVVYVFDGKPPELKAKEIEARLKSKEEAEKKYEKARELGDIELMRRYAMATSKLTKDMVDEAKKLLEAMGIPYVQAPEEGEAQAAYIASRGDSWAAGSQDYDSLLFGSPRLVRNLAITGKRKLPRRNVYVEIKPEIIYLDKLLKTLDLTRKHLVLIGIMLGTDYNPGGIPGIGPKRALTLVRSLRDEEKILAYIEKQGVRSAREIYNYFLQPKVTDNYTLEWRAPDSQSVKRILVDEHDFNPIRVERALERLQKAYKEKLKPKRRGLDAWF